MTRGAFIPGALAGALLLGIASEISAMSLPPLPSAQDLAGDWSLRWAGGACDVTLSTQPVSVSRPASDAWAFTLAPDCVAPAGLDQMRAWRPASDGVELTDANGRTRLFLSRSGPGAHEGTLPSGETVRLTRA